MLVDRVASMLLAVLVYAIGQPGAERNHVGFQSVYLVLAAGVSRGVPHRRPVQPVRRVRDDAHRELRAAHARRTPRAGALGHDLRRHQPARVDAVRHRARAALRRDRHGQHGRPRRQDRRRCPAACAARSPCCCSSCSASRPALFPLFFWLPDSYPTAPSPVTAVFAGLLTKVGVYAIIRTQTLLFPADTRPATLLLVLAGAHDGGRRARRDRPGRRQADPVVQHRQPDRLHGDGPRRSSPSPASPAAIFYIVHHIVVKTTLFLTGGLDRARRRIEPPQPARRHGPHRARARRAVPASRR